jgi:hypothetical protein
VRALLTPNESNYRPHDEDPEDSEGEVVEEKVPTLENPVLTVGFVYSSSHEMLDATLVHACPTLVTCLLVAPSSGHVVVPRCSGCKNSLAHPLANAQGTSSTTPHIISSLDTSGYASTRKTGNTGVKHKNLSIHRVIVEAAKTSRELLA